MKINAIPFGIIALALVVACAGAVCAYNAMPTPEDMGLNYSISAGAAMSVNSKVNNGTRPTINFNWFGPAESAFGDNAAFGLSGDWIGLQRNDGQNVNLGLFTVNYKVSAILSSYRVFVVMGLGIRYSSDNVPEMRIGQGTQFGWDGGIGIDFTNNIFGQARFIAGQNPGQDGMTALELGYRF
jgi:hypothetical protein